MTRALQLLGAWFLTMAATLAVALLLSGSGAVLGQTLPVVVGVHAVSYHADSMADVPGSRGFNNINPGLYARWPSGFTVGAYRNSLYRNSAYAGWTFTDQAEHFGLTVGLVSGYDVAVPAGQGDRQAVRCDRTYGCRTVGLRDVLAPLVVPSVRLPLTDRASVRLSALLAVKQAPAVHLSLEWRL